VFRFDDEQYWLSAAVYPETRSAPYEARADQHERLRARSFTELREKHDVDDVVFLVDGATPLKDACNRHGLDFRYERHGNRNSVERVFREVKREELPCSRTVSVTLAQNC